MPVASMDWSRSLENYTQLELLESSFHTEIILFVVLTIKKKQKKKMDQHMLISNLVSEATACVKLAESMSNAK